MTRLVFDFGPKRTYTNAAKAIAIPIGTYEAGELERVTFGYRPMTTQARGYSIDQTTSSSLPTSGRSRMSPEGRDEPLHRTLAGCGQIQPLRTMPQLAGKRSLDPRVECAYVEQPGTVTALDFLSGVPKGDSQCPIANGAL